MPCAPERRALATRAPVSTVSSQTSCAKAVTLPAVMELAGNPSMERSEAHFFFFFVKSVSQRVTFIK